MERTATLLIDRPVADDEEVEEIIVSVLEGWGIDPLDPTIQVEWIESDEIPPIGLPLHEQDQMLAHKRDNEESVFFTILLEDSGSVAE